MNMGSPAIPYSTPLAECQVQTIVVDDVEIELRGDKTDVIAIFRNQKENAAVLGLAMSHAQAAYLGEILSSLGKTDAS